MKKRRVLPLPGKANTPCPCGSGRVLAQCCGSKALAQRMAAAVVAHQSGRIDEAFAGYAAILAEAPDHADALHYLGVIHFQRGDYAAAAAQIRQAIGLRRDVAAYHVNLGHALKRLGEKLAAAAAYAEALRLKPDWAEIWCELGKLLYAEEAIDAAAEAFESAIKLNPRLAAGHHQLAILQLRFGEVDAALHRFDQAQACDPANERICASRLFALGLSSAHSGNDLLIAHQDWQHRFADGIAPKVLSPHVRGERLRIGYLSGDFRQHAMRFFVRPLLRHHDRQRVHVTAYATHAPAAADAVTGTLKSLADDWVDCHALDDSALAQRIAADGIDVLIDLAGHSAGGRMLALAEHPARLQCTMLGYMTTTGARAMDARIADAVAIPLGAEAWFSEAILRLPHSQWCYEPDAVTPPVGEAPALRNGFVTYGAFHNVAKINARVLDLWVRLLDSQPQARLLMVGWGEAAQRWLRAPFEKAGMEARVTVLDPLPYDRYLTLYDQIDVALDVFPYAGGTVSCEALWMGVPVLTLAHDSPAGRGGASIMTAMDMPAWIATDETDLISRAAGLADPLALAALRAGLRERLRVSPLMDAPAYAGALERLLASRVA